jgi:hypothetical protein
LDSSSTDVISRESIIRDECNYGHSIGIFKDPGMDPEMMPFMQQEGIGQIGILKKEDRGISTKECAMGLSPFLAVTGY